MIYENCTDLEVVAAVRALRTIPEASRARIKEIARRLELRALAKIGGDAVSVIFVASDDEPLDEELLLQELSEVAGAAAVGLRLPPRPVMELLRRMADVALAEWYASEAIVRSWENAA